MLFLGSHLRERLLQNRGWLLGNVNTTIGGGKREQIDHSRQRDECQREAERETER